MKSLQRGFTIVELAFTLIFFVAIGLSGTILWAIAHFVAKFW